MSAIVVPGRLVSPTHIELARPVNVMEGDVEVQIRPSHPTRRSAALSLLQSMLASPSRGRSTEDIDAQIRSERDSWEREVPRT